MRVLIGSRNGTMRARSVRWPRRGHARRVGIGSPNSRRGVGRAAEVVQGEGPRGRGRCEDGGSGYRTSIWFQSMASQLPEASISGERKRRGTRQRRGFSLSSRARERRERGDRERKRCCVRVGFGLALACRGRRPLAFVTARSLCNARFVFVCGGVRQPTNHGPMDEFVPSFLLQIIFLQILKSLYFY